MRLQVLTQQVRLVQSRKPLRLLKDEICLDSLTTFGEEMLSGDLMRAAECFHVRCLATIDAKTLDHLKDYGISTFTSLKVEGTFLKKLGRAPILGLLVPKS